MYKYIVLVEFIIINKSFVGLVVFIIIIIIFILIHLLMLLF